jgi:hypothetical protein
MLPYFNEAATVWPGRGVEESAWAPPATALPLLDDVEEEKVLISNGINNGTRVLLTTLWTTRMPFSRAAMMH